jgi:transposase-like protein
MEQQKRAHMQYKFSVWNQTHQDSKAKYQDVKMYFYTLVEDKTYRRNNQSLSHVSKARQMHLILTAHDHNKILEYLGCSKNGQFPL